MKDEYLIHAVCWHERHQGKSERIYEYWMNGGNEELGKTAHGHFIHNSEDAWLLHVCAVLCVFTMWLLACYRIWPCVPLNSKECSDNTRRYWVLGVCGNTMGRESNDMYWEQSSCWSPESQWKNSRPAEVQCRQTSYSAILNQSWGMGTSLQPSGRGEGCFLLSRIISLYRHCKTNRTERIEFSFLISSSVVLFWLPHPGLQTIHCVNVIFSQNDCFPHPTTFWGHRDSVPKPTKLPFQTAFYMLIGIIVKLLKEVWSQSKEALNMFFTDKSIPEYTAQLKTS